MSRLVLASGHDGGESYKNFPFHPRRKSRADDPNHVATLRMRSCQKIARLNRNIRLDFDCLQMCRNSVGDTKERTGAENKFTVEQGSLRIANGGRGRKISE